MPIWPYAASISNSRLRSSSGPTLEREDTREDYGKRRVVAIGLAQGIALTVVYTDRTTAAATERRIISARRSNRRERKAYEDAFKLG